MEEEKSKEAEATKGAERRRHIRLCLMGLATLSIPGGEPEEAYMACIGRGGMGLYAKPALKQSQLVVVSLTLSDEDLGGREMKVGARVRWAKPTGKLYMLGLQFEEMPLERYRLLLKHLHRMKQLQL